MIQHLFDKASTVGKDPVLLLNRFKMAIDVLKGEYRLLFPKRRKLTTDEFKNKRYLSRDERFALQWVNEGETSQGTVYVVTMSVSLSETSGV